VAGGIRGDEVEVRPGEFVGAVTAVMQRGMVRMVRSRMVTATASQPDVWSTAELSGRTPEQQELAPATPARDRPRSCVVSRQSTDYRDSAPRTGRVGLNRGRTDSPRMRGRLRACGDGRSHQLRDYAPTTLTLRPRRGLGRASSTCWGLPGVYGHG
jgi:hypothetical protein